MTMKTRLLLVVAILGTAFLLCGSGPPPAFADASHPWQSAGLRPSEPHAQPQNDAQDEVKEFKGKISKSNGRFVLEESSDGGTCPTKRSMSRKLRQSRNGNDFNGEVFMGFESSIPPGLQR